MTYRALVQPDLMMASRRRFGVLASSALCSVALVGAILQISSAIAADIDLSSLFTPASDTVKLLTVAPVVSPDGLILNMKPGDDLARLGPSGFVFDATFGTTATISGGSGADFLDVTANTTLTVGGLTTIKSVETVRVSGTFNADGGLDLLGTGAGDVML